MIQKQPWRGSRWCRGSSPFWPRACRARGRSAGRNAINFGLAGLRRRPAGTIGPGRASKTIPGTEWRTTITSDPTVPVNRRCARAGAARRQPHRQRSARRTCPPDRAERSVRRIRPRRRAPRGRAPPAGAAAGLCRRAAARAAAAPADARRRYDVTAMFGAAGAPAARNCRRRLRRRLYARDPDYAPPAYADAGIRRGRRSPVMPSTKCPAIERAAYHPNNPQSGAERRALSTTMSRRAPAHGRPGDRRGFRAGRDRHRRRLRLSRAFRLFRRRAGRRR